MTHKIDKQQGFTLQHRELWGFPGGSVVKNPPANAGDVGLIPGCGRPSGGGNGNPLQYYSLENLIDRGAQWVTVHGVIRSWTERATEHKCIGKYPQYLVINQNDKEDEKKYIYKMNHFTAQLKLTQYCKSTILQLKNIKF